MEKKISMSDLLKALKKNLKLLIILPLIFMFIGGILTYLLMHPKYEATTQLLVNKKETNNEVTSQNIQSDLQLVNTYSEIIKSPRILEKVSDNLDNKYSVKSLQSMLNVNNQKESQILNVSIVSNSKASSVKIANEIAHEFSKEANKIMDIDNISILSKANDNAPQVAPNYSLNIGVSLVLGIFIALIIIIFKELFDRRIKTETDVEEILDLPVLGSIPDFNKFK